MAAWTDEDSRRLRELHEQGLSLRAIAERMDRPKVTIGRWAKKLELTFGTERTAEATAVKVLNARERRAEAAERELELLEFEQKRALDVHHKRGEWMTLRRGEGGAEYVTGLDFIPARDLREHANARASMAVNIDKLTDHTTEHDDAKSMLGQLEAKLIAAVQDEIEEAGESGDSR
ncbi:helix-turn-helix domain-containing protein [Rhodococcus phenolicus]|uniref:helix-turn-helix domain-containing protein n=1 Tax=Rhodococcus phenolicus TaxID=263849 RepID=UPI00082CAF97|nr:helix-turn-helix domain-containing protein [Rhodococcus phenolicus]